MQMKQSCPTSEMRAGYVQVGTSAAVLTALSFKFTNGLTIRANTGNSGQIYIGDAAVSATNGYQLSAGESVFIQVEDPSQIYVIGSAASQNISWIGV